MNSGLADVHNLAYKIAAVHHGWAKNTLLDTYDADRRHIAEVNSQQSVKNGKKIFSLLKALGTTGSDIDQARQNLLASLSNPTQKAHIDSEVEGQQEHFDNVSTFPLRIQAETYLRSSSFTSATSTVPRNIHPMHHTSHHNSSKARDCHMSGFSRLRRFLIVFPSL